MSQSLRVQRIKTGEKALRKGLVEVKRQGIINPTDEQLLGKGTAKCRKRESRF